MDEINDKYTLVGVDGNAFAVMAYTKKALKETGLKSEVKKMMQEATSGDYSKLLSVCQKYIEMANAEYKKKGEV